MEGESNRHPDEPRGLYNYNAIPSFGPL